MIKFEKSFIILYALYVLYVFLKEWH